MKKFYITFLALAAAGMSVNAQQLPNVGFEGNWKACTPWTSNGNSSTQGENPEGWCISHVIGMGGTGAATLGAKTTGYNSTNAVNLKQVFTGFLSIGSNVPAYITLGTTWSTSQGTLSIKNTDGGTFGGLEFTGRPDAFSFYYKRSRGTDKPDERSSAIAYIWKGSWTQASVPGNIGSSASAVKKVDMVDRDRCVLGYDMTGTQGGTVTNNGGVLIASTINYITSNASDWTNALYEFDYKTTDTPEKINIIISAGDYFGGTSAVGKDNELTVDDVKLIYFSRLNTLSVGGNSVEGFAPDKYEYTLDTTMPAESEFAYTLKGNSGTAKASLALDTENNKATITVSNAQGEDIDGAKSHTYTLNFKAAEPPVQRVGTPFNGTLTVTLEEEDPVVDPNATVYIEANDTNHAVLRLYNFKLSDELEVGDIVVDVLREPTEDGGCKMTGEVHHMELLGGFIIANVSVDAYEKDGYLTASIPVVWLQEKTDDGYKMNIDVTFNGTGESLPASISAVSNDNTNAPVEYYNLQGMRVNADNLSNGIYIRRQGSESAKVLIRK